VGVAFSPVALLFVLVEATELAVFAMGIGSYIPVAVVAVFVGAR
jgi:hypothetical protein